MHTQKALAVRNKLKSHIMNKKLHITYKDLHSIQENRYTHIEWSLFNDITAFAIIVHIALYKRICKHNLIWVFQWQLFSCRNWMRHGCPVRAGISCAHFHRTNMCMFICMYSMSLLLKLHPPFSVVLGYSELDYILPAVISNHLHLFYIMLPLRQGGG